MSVLFNLSLMPSPFESTAPSAIGTAIPSSPAPLVSSLNSGESDLQVTADWGAGEAFLIGDDLVQRAEQAGYLIVAKASWDRMAALIVELQAEREADRIDHADYERLKEKERIELLTPPPMFLQRKSSAAP